MSRRDVANVAWHEVPGIARHPVSRPVGNGMIRAGVRNDSMIGVTKHGGPFDEKYQLRRTLPNRGIGI